MINRTGCFFRFVVHLKKWTAICNANLRNHCNCSENGFVTTNIIPKDLL